MEHTKNATSPVRAVRADGWTPEAQHIFVAALAQSGCVRRAAQAAQRSHVSAYKHRAKPEAAAFRAAWDAALGLAYTRLHELAMERIRNGLEQRTYDPDGKLVARRIVHNDRLLMFLLEHNRPTRPVVHLGFNGQEARRFDPPSRDDDFGSAMATLEASAPAFESSPDAAWHDADWNDTWDDSG